MIKRFDKEQYDKAQRGGESSSSDQIQDDEAVIIQELSVAEQLQAALAVENVNTKLKSAIGQKLQKNKNIVKQVNF